MQIAWYEADGTAHVLHDAVAGAGVGQCDLTVTRLTGAGMPGVRDVVHSGPYQHGETWDFGRLTTRMLRLTIDVHTFGTHNDLMAGRRELARWFNPNSDSSYGLGRLRIVTDVTREIECRYNAGLAFDETLDDVDTVVEDVTLYAPDPLWYDPTQVEVGFASGNLQTVQFPLTLPAYFVAGDALVVYQQCVNAGDWVVYPKITVTGPGSSPTIYNLTTGERLALNGYTLANGEQVVFDLSFGSKRITSDMNGNLVPYLSSDSSLATWHLAADPEAAGGVNDVYVGLDNALSGTTAALIAWYNRYLTI